MSRLRNGFFVSAEGDERFVFAIINGSMVQLEDPAPDEPLYELAPGYYDRALKSVPAAEAEAEDIEKAADLRTLYVKRRLTNGDAIRAWAATLGIESTLPPEDMHATIAFSKEPVDWSLIEPHQEVVVIQGGARALHQFPARNTPNGALVLKFESPDLEHRWRELRDAGASWDFPEYQSHITITYSVPDASGLEGAPYRGPLIFGPEEFAEVDEGWAGEIEEVPLAKRRRQSRRV